ncbi:hypothetical protein GCM10009539_73450 [Cryptosporangium japonicum]|uniref:Uncharacterized protein n=1 Tax=Cryptosporangium japonicum TaxID=80872 RepID=A0ABN0V4I2_9ACTN
MTTASATHKPITNHGTHGPTGAFPVGAALTAIDVPPTRGLHRLSDTDVVPSESETTVKTAGAAAPPR